MPMSFRYSWALRPCGTSEASVLPPIPTPPVLEAGYASASRRSAPSLYSRESTGSADLHFDVAACGDDRVRRNLAVLAGSRRLHAGAVERVAVPTSMKSFWQALVITGRR